ncbi:MAG: signal peptidase [Thermoguttaceae bacterium]|nr:signal peptidase [Thermoguttaceae bacterium]
MSDQKYIARYSAMRLMGVFQFESETALFPGARVIVRTSRGQEAATILREATEEAVARIPSRHEEGPVLRIMTPDDEIECRRIRAAEKDEFFRARAIIDQAGLGMNLVRVEHIYGGERLIVYYVADGRVDFRVLLRHLAAEFQTRIQMFQIGVRDETRLMADVGDCGREACCNTFLSSMLSVNMKMAKIQKANLDPTKISGRCGRLKCCLTYEYETYKELVAILPAIGSTVATPDGPGIVVGQELLAKRLQVETKDGARKFFTIDEIEKAAAGSLPTEDPGPSFDDGADYPGSTLPAGTTGKPSSVRRGERRRGPKGRPHRGERPAEGRGEYSGGRPESGGGPHNPPHHGGRPTGPRKGGPRPFERGGPPRQSGGPKPPRQFPPPSDSPRRFRPENRDRGFHHKRRESE